nr:hypothetical protein CFP56_79453 [Quercus suber]
MNHKYIQFEARRLPEFVRLVPMIRQTFAYSWTMATMMVKVWVARCRIFVHVTILLPSEGALSSVLPMFFADCCVFGRVVSCLLVTQLSLVRLSHEAIANGAMRRKHCSAVVLSSVPTPCRTRVSVAKSVTAGQ